jgi:TATA-box binding protein (TBP) (component of TFIID and TFIIIB)
MVEQPPRKRVRTDDPFVDDFVSRLRPGKSAEVDYTKLAKSYVWAQNIVTNVKLGSTVDLRKFSSTRSNGYVPGKFEACVVRVMIKKRNATILLFRPASAVAAGTHSIAHTIKAAHYVRMCLYADGKPTTFEAFRLNNMVYSTRKKSKVGVDIAAINKQYASSSVYIPLMFPGMQYYAKIATDEKNPPQQKDGTSVAKKGVAKKRDKIFKVRLFDTWSKVGMGIVNPRDVAPIFDGVEELFKSNPDENLPPSEERFDYREEKKQKASSMPSQHWTEVDNSSGEEDGR